MVMSSVPSHLRIGDAVMAIRPTWPISFSRAASVVMPGPDLRKMTIGGRGRARQQCGVSLAYAAKPTGPGAVR
jgi:hypothetical protein